MKKIKCLDCDKEFTTETSEKALNAMVPRHQSDHAEMMEKANEEKQRVLTPFLY